MTPTPDIEAVKMNIDEQNMKLSTTKQVCAYCGHEHMLHARCKLTERKPNDITSDKFKKLMGRYVEVKK